MVINGGAMHVDELFIEQLGLDAQHWDWDSTAHTHTHTHARTNGLLLKHHGMRTIACVCMCDCASHLLS